MSIEKLRPSFTFTEDRLEELKQLVPEAFSEGKINWEVLKEILGDYLENPAQENFGLRWPGKRESRRLVAALSKGTLIPRSGEGLSEEDTKNIFIEGENLEVLKIIQKSYAGCIKMIYIDPPYNTGNDFIYFDNYSEPLEAYLQKTGQKNKDGLALTSNTKSSGRFHSNWLSMMYPRLLIARKLLKEDGVIFISIDDNEIFNLRILMNEVFGEENFIGQICYVNNPKGRSQDKYIATNHEYCVVYSKTQLPKGALSVPKSDLEVEKDYPLEDELGLYRELELRNTHREFGLHNRPNLYYPFVVNEDGKLSLDPVEGGIEIYPDWDDGFQGCWTWDINKSRKDLNLLVPKEVKGRTKIFRKNYGRYRGSNVYKQMKSLWVDKRYHTEKGQSKFNELFETKEKIFQSPKSVDLLQDLILMSNCKNEIVMDFFAGSSSIAHAVFTQNLEDNGNRHFILVQLPEKLNPNDKDQKQAVDFCKKNNLPLNISEISKERIRRVIESLEERKTGQLGENDFGFKVFRLTKSNFRDWSSEFAGDINKLETLFDKHETPLIDDWKVEDLLWETILNLGFPLNSKITYVRKTRKNSIMKINHNDISHVIYICFDSKLDDDVIKQLNLGFEDYFICLDSALSDNIKIRYSDTCNLRVI